MTGPAPHLTRRRLLALSGAALALAPAVQAKAPAVQHLDGRAFGSTWRVTLPDASGAERLRPALDALLARIDRAMSPWRADSEITAFNRASAAAGISGESAHVVAAALGIAAASDGWFDPAIGPLVHQWGFGPIEGAPGGWRGLQLQDRHLSKADPRLTFDPCGIAKGRALDQMTEALIAAGHEHFLIDLGGELAARGYHPSGRDWQIAIEDPRPDAPGSAAVLRLDGKAVATSGNRVQGYDLGGRRYSHIIDPRAARPALGTLASVTVLSDRAMIADGWATALMAAGEAGPALAARNHIAALFLFVEAGGLRPAMSGDMQRHIL
ncbi:MAG: FAD:protein FMN transferase [Rhodobacteraceae bacterium]|nr:FAD:protein FMN transferase [Paracoccaceae bacterium]